MGLMDGQGANKREKTAPDRWEGKGKARQREKGMRPDSIMTYKESRPRVIADN